ncbi:GrpB family protein [Spirosoma sp. 209]|uniref:GrpB family protein n=1 Tax=Spirosoma sp. 209 TaxID=1955701 RepID=UPI00098D652D|nr:GrpB family protein [Spirosoma sp. 209]
MVVEPYKESWVGDFSALKRVLEEALTNLPVSVEHVGSTSVPGLAAKPVIDIDLIFDQPIVFDDIKSRLEAIGYYHAGDQGIAGREVFKRAHADPAHTVLDSIPHHLYVCRADSDEWQKHRLFRNYLIAHEDARAHYQRLKYDLARAANQDRKRYAQLKEQQATAFINDIIEKARLDETRTDSNRLS